MLPSFQPKSLSIVITMAGEGSRFRSAGYSGPKHEIVTHGHSLLEWSLLSLKNFFEHHFILVGRKDNWNISAVGNCCRNLGINNFDCIELSETTNGQADTVTKAAQLIKGSDSGLLIYNIDTYVESQHLRPSMIRGKGWIPVFEAPGDIWSFCSIDANSDVVQVAEKKRISDLATIGLYYFDSYQCFESALSSCDFSGYREQFVAPIYNELIKSGGQVVAEIIPSKAVHALGTPNDLLQFNPAKIKTF